MGWLWSSSSSKPTEASSPSQPPSQSVPVPAPAPKAVSSPADSDDAEIQKFLDLIKAEESSTTPSTHKPTQAPAWITNVFSRGEDTSIVDAAAPTRDALSESLLPTEMSCRQAFDLAWGCNSVGGQWNGVYREGGMRSCSEQWNDFWFCMRTKSHVGPVKDSMVRAHYRSKDYRKYYATDKHSSEDVWEARETKVEPGSVFSQSMDLPSVDDEEWRKGENERRNKIRGELGFENEN